MVQEDGRKGLRGLDTWWDRRGEGYGGALGGAEENVGGGWYGHEYLLQVLAEYKISKLGYSVRPLD